MKELTIDVFKCLFDHLENTPGTLIWIRSIDYLRQLYLSPSFENVWEIPSEIFYENKDAWETTLIPDEKQILLNEVHRRIHQTEEVDESVLFYQIRTPNIEKKYIKDEAFILTTADGEPVANIGIAKELPFQQWYEEKNYYLDKMGNNVEQNLKKYLFEIIKNELKLNVSKNKSNLNDKKTFNPNLIGYEITDRESECLDHLVTGKTAKETAKIMDISPRTVEFHINNIKEKMGVKSKLELISKVIKISDR